MGWSPHQLFNSFHSSYLILPYRVDFWHSLSCFRITLWNWSSRLSYLEIMCTRIISSIVWRFFHLWITSLWCVTPLWFYRFLVSQHFPFSQYLIGCDLLQVIITKLRFHLILCSPLFGLIDLGFDPFGWSLWLSLTPLLFYLALNEVVIDLLIREYSL